jgi:pimeloyl-ACP methyl ester carboxylesterase
MGQRPATRCIGRKRIWTIASRAAAKESGVRAVRFFLETEDPPVNDIELEDASPRSGSGPHDDTFLKLLKPRRGAAALRDSAGHPRLFVFVHGLHGDHIDTWTNETTRAYWPKLVRDDTRTFGATDVAVFDYFSPALESAPGVKDIARALRGWLATSSATDYDDVICVAHSLGGVIVRQLLVELGRDRDRLLGKIRLVLAMAPAFGGSDVAKIFDEVGSKNPQFDDVRTDSPFLVDLNGRWETLREELDPQRGERPYLLSAWGQGDQVVTRESAERFSDVISGANAGPPVFPRVLNDADIVSGLPGLVLHQTDALHHVLGQAEPDEHLLGPLVHIDIVRPDGSEHVSHKLLREAFQLWQSKPSVSRA